MSKYSFINIYTFCVHCMHCTHVNIYILLIDHHSEVEDVKLLATIITIPFYKQVLYTTGNSRNSLANLYTWLLKTFSEKMQAT